MKVELISDLYEVEDLSYDFIADQLFRYLNSDQQLEFASSLARTFDIDIEAIWLNGGLEPEEIVKEADYYFSDIIQKDFIDWIYKNYDL
ncbi:MAG: hypothetical protein J1F35_08700 [Erysipelotrichales bacterium]|nr:hypothetical protein [Erysipelotrichales bacterium]